MVAASISTEPEASDQKLCLVAGVKAPFPADKGAPLHA